MEFLLILFYFIPSFIAGLRAHRNLAPVIALNLFLGWTGIGWVLALIWSFTYQGPDQ